jgi:hypothetical protein
LEGDSAAFPSRRPSVSSFHRFTHTELVKRQHQRSSGSQLLRSYFGDCGNGDFHVPLGSVGAEKAPTTALPIPTKAGSEPTDVANERKQLHAGPTPEEADWLGAALVLGHLWDEHGIVWARPFGHAASAAEQCLERCRPGL